MSYQGKFTDTGLSDAGFRKKTQRTSSVSPEKDDLGIVDIIADDLRLRRLTGRVRLVVYVFFAAAGVGAALISFMIEENVFTHFTGQARLAFWMVLVLETAKVGGHVVYTPENIAPSIYVRMLPAVRIFLALLVGISFVCTLALLSLHLDRPRLEETRARDLAALADSRKTAEEGLIAAHSRSAESLRNDFRRRTETERNILLKNHQSRLGELNRKLDREMNNVVKNSFDGPRYKAFEQRITAENTAHAAEMAAFQRRVRSDEAAVERRIREREIAHLKRLNSLREEFRRRRNEIEQNDYAADERASNPMLAATLRTLNTGIFTPLTGSAMPEVIFAALFSLAVALALEMAIFICLRVVNLSAPGTGEGRAG